MNHLSFINNIFQKANMLHEMKRNVNIFPYRKITGKRRNKTQMKKNKEKETICIDYLVFNLEVIFIRF